MLTEIYQRSNRNTISPLDGAWHLDKRVYIDKEGKSETIQSADSAKQFKIYDSGNFMWASSYFNKPSNKWASSFGYGTFTMDGSNQITETNAQSTYASLLIGKPVKITFNVNGKDSYEQVIEDADGAKQIEYYSRLK
ncbi:hypothetical protein HRG84_10160 [Flavisolibacter sp. BT320]|nr:hypothetical protein [Flavisolibacter longurius]